MGKRKPLPAAETLAERLEYDPSTGALRWKHRACARPEWNARYAGEVAGAICKEGYIIIGLDGRPFKAHRVAWVLHYGRPPSASIDHINGDKRDNRIENLRDVPEKGNARNRSLRSDNSTGAPGVYRLSNRAGWYAQGRRAGKNVHLGVFDSFDEASAARRKFQAENGYHRNHGRAGPLASADVAIPGRAVSNRATAGAAAW